MKMQEAASAGSETVVESKCPGAAAMRRLGGKWSLEAIAALRERALRNHELLRALPGISPKVLAQTLRDLESEGLVLRTEYEASVRHVEYSLTELGRSLNAALVDVDRWAQQHGQAAGQEK